MIPLEIAILEASAEFESSGQPEIHGYLLATRIQEFRNAKRLTAYGTLYKALTRLERAGYLASRWEDPNVAAAESRPRRRFYRLTLEGERALNSARAADRATPKFERAAARAR